MRGKTLCDSLEGEMYRHETVEAPGAEPLTGQRLGAPGAPGLLRGFDRAQAHVMTAEEIDHLVRRGISGRFALGYRDARGAFRIQYVGYAPYDLNAELKARWRRPCRISWRKLRRL